MIFNMKVKKEKKRKENEKNNNNFLIKTLIKNIKT